MFGGWRPQAGGAHVWRPAASGGRSGWWRSAARGGRRLAAVSGGLRWRPVVGGAHVWRPAVGGWLTGGGLSIWQPLK